MKLLLSFFILLSFSTYGKSLIEPTPVPDTEELDIKAIPFAFHSDMLKTTLGAAAVMKSAFQPQATLFSGGIYSSNNSWAWYGGAYNYQLPNVSQWLINIDTLSAHYKQGFYYFVDDKENPIANDAQRHILDAKQGFTRMYLQYVLPFGEGKKGAVATLKNDISPEDLINVKDWSPDKSGITSITFTPFYQYLDFQQPVEQQITDVSQGLEVEIDYDNRNSMTMPSEGFQLQTRVRKDWGSASRTGWTRIEAELSKFFNLGANKFFQQQTIALNVLLADTPSWNKTTNGKYKRPPNFDAVTLGGWDQLRGYDDGRFYGRSAISYSIEYRGILSWHPLSKLPVIKGYQMPWWQWVAFIDAGQVSPNFSIKELHKNMHISVGAGIRINIEGIVARLDYAKGGEDSQFRVIINQPF